MEKFNTSLLQTIKWEQNNAPNLQSMINSKNDWYLKYNDAFWDSWYKDVFNIDTCNSFGIYIWCEILGIPKGTVNLEVREESFAFGVERKNFLYSGTDPSIPAPDRETVGGNFFGSGQNVIYNIDEARIMLKLRYAALTSDGRISNINRMLKWIFNQGKDWDFSSGQYAYVTDKTQQTATVSSVNYIKDPSLEDGPSTIYWVNGFPTVSAITFSPANARTGNYEYQILGTSISQNMNISTKELVNITQPFSIGDKVNIGVWIKKTPGATVSLNSMKLQLFDRTAFVLLAQLIIQPSSLTDNVYTMVSFPYTFTANYPAGHKLTVSFSADGINGSIGHFFYVDDFFMSPPPSSDGDYIVRDWQGSTRIKVNTTQKIMTAGNTWDGVLTSGSPGAKLTSSMGANARYFWSGAPLPPSASGVQLVGGDNRMYNGPDWYGQQGNPTGVEQGSITNALRLVKLNAPITSVGPTNELVYCQQPSYNTGLPVVSSTVGTKYIYSCFVKQLSKNVKSVSLTEYKARYAHTDMFVDPVRIFVDLQSGEYQIIGASDTSIRPKSRGGVQKYPDGWFRVWFYEQLAVPYATTYTSLGVMPYSTVYNNVNPETINIGDDLMVFGYCVTEVAATAPIPAAPEYYSYLHGATTPYALIALNIGATSNTITVERGSNISTTAASTISNSLLQPTASLAFDGVLAGQFYSPAIPLVQDADGNRRSFTIASNVNPPAPPTQDFFMQYYFGSGFNFSDGFKNVISNRDNGILPSNAGIGFGVGTYIPDLSDIILTTQAIDYRIITGAGGSDQKITFVSTQSSIGIGFTDQATDYWPLNYQLGNFTLALGREYPTAAKPALWLYNAAAVNNTTVLLKTRLSGNTTTLTNQTAAANSMPVGQWVLTQNTPSDATGTGYAVFAAQIANKPAPPGIYTLSIYCINSGNVGTKAFDVGYGDIDSLTPNIIGQITMPAAALGLTRSTFTFNAPNGIGNDPLTNLLTIGSIGKSGTLTHAGINIRAMSLEAGSVATAPVFSSSTFSGKPATILSVTNPGKAALGFRIHFIDGATKDVFFNGAASAPIPFGDYDFLTQLINKITYLTEV